MSNDALIMFSQRIRQLRTELNLTQKGFADEIGLTASALSAYEKNTTNPSIAVAVKVAEKYHVSIDWLCGLTDKRNAIELRTYADVYNSLIGISEKVFFELEYLQGLLPSMGSTGSISFSDKNIVDFIKEWSKSLKLLNKNVIDKEMFENLMNVIIEKYNGNFELPSSPSTLSNGFGIYIKHK